MNMPSTYAHYRLGKEVIQKLDPDLRAIAEGHRQLYDIGLHGPDILFYYDALHRNPTSQIGFDMHGFPAPVLLRRPPQEPDQPDRVRHARIPCEGLLRTGP